MSRRVIADKLITMSHPNFFTINLLKNLILTAPVTFSKARKEEMLSKVEQYIEDSGADLAAIEETMIRFGKEIWPYRESYVKIYEQYGRKPEEERIATFLSGELKIKYQKFLSDRGNIEKIETGSPSLESYFTPDEQAAMVEAELKAHDEVHGKIEKMILADKQEEYQILLEQYKNEARQIEELLLQLKKIALRAPLFVEEIALKIKTFEEGFGFLERPVSVTDVQSEIDYYLGVAGLET